MFHFCGQCLNLRQMEVGLSCLCAGNEKTCITDCFVIAVRVDGRAEAFDFKEIERFEDFGDILEGIGYERKSCLWHFLKGIRKQMKKISIFYTLRTMIVCAAIIAFIPVSVFAKEQDSKEYEFEGNGTKYDPYLISSYEDLSGLRDIVDSGNNLNGKYFRQTADIVFPDGENWNPIGALMTGYEFAGLYDGSGHTLSNIYCEDQYAGVFTYLAGEIRNLGIESGSFHGNCAGSITSHGTNTAKIINCYNKADVYADGRAGGITDNYPGMIMFCWNFGNVTGISESVVTAGITSYGEADIKYCYAVDAEKLTDDSTFTGTVSESFVIEKEDIASHMQQSYLDLFGIYSEPEEEEIEVNRGNTVFMIYENGKVFFDKDYEPEIFLAEKEAQKEEFIEIWENSYRFDGEGSEENPFLISTYEDLAHLRDCVDIGIRYDGYYFEQTEDIYFPEGESWNPIGEVKAQKAFSGTYNGRGHCLYNVYCEDKYAGVFSYLNGEVRNLAIENGYFSGECVGSITSHGTSNARIINCYNKASVEGIYRAGGLVDNYPGELLFSWNFGTVSGEKEDTVVAGLCSYGRADIQYCYSTGTTKVVSAETFQGTLYESGRILDEDIGEKLKANEVAYKNYLKDKTLEPDNMVFLKISDAHKIIYDKTYVPEELKKMMKMEYIPALFLIVMIVIWGIVIGGVYYRYSKAGKLIDISRDIKKNDKAETVVLKSKLSRREMGTIAGSVIFTIAVFCVVFSYVTRTLNWETAAGILNLRYWNKAENENTDILLLGGSSMSVNIEISELWKKYGMACYCLGAGGSVFYDDYYRLIEAEKTHHSNMVVVEIRAASYFTEYSLSEFKKENVSGLSISLNKLHYANAAIEPEQRLYYLLTFPIYHGKYNSVTKWDFQHTSSLGENDKGTWTVFYGNKYEPELICSDDIIGYQALYPKEEYYLKKIIEYCDMNNIDLLLLKTPDGNREINQPFYNTVGIIAEKNGVPFLDMNQFDEEIGLTSSDFYYDNYHLNVSGARKCTIFFGDYLKEHYDLPDHRGDENYVSWDRFAANREDLYLRAITDNEDYFAELERDHKKVIAISYRLSGEKSEKYLDLTETLDKGDYELYDKRDVLYGTNNIILLTLFKNNISITKVYSACQIDINGETKLSVDSPGLILIIYDEVMDDIADVAAFTRANNFTVEHLYGGGYD